MYVVSLVAQKDPMHGGSSSEERPISSARAGRDVA